MTVPDDVQHRTTHEADPDAVEVRQPESVDDEGDLFRIRMPVTSTAEARDGEAFGRDKVEGFRDQLQATRIPLFLDHGRGGPGETRYSQLRKVGYWDNPELVDRNGATEMDADAVLVDPDTLSEDVGDIRGALAWLRAQAEAGLPISSSVGWSEEVGERDVPGDADLLEISIVGIPSDPRTTTTAAGEPALARAVAAASDGFDVATFVRELAAADGERPLGPPDDPDRFDSFEECVDALSDDPDLSEADAERICGAWEQQKDAGRNVVEVGGEEIDLSPPEAVQNAATLALAKDDELEPDCGTGAGRQSAQQIAGDDVTAERIDDIAAYLTSHEEDVTAKGPPSDWSNEEWADCGNLQYAMWGGTGTGTGLEWAQSKANDVAEAAGEELPYPDRAARNLDDPEFSEGDAVEWTSNDVIVRGRVADIGDEFEPAEGVTITGDEGEAVYLIHELDDSLEPPQYRRENVAKPESSLDESQADLPPLEGNFADEENDMTESESTESAEEADTDRDEPDEMDAAEFRQSMLEMQREQTEMLQTLATDMGDDEDDGDDMGDDEDDDADRDGSPDADADETRTVTLDGQEVPVDEALADLRDQAADADPADPETQDRAEAAEDEDTAGGRPEWRA